MKTCSKCKEVKDLSNFFAQKNGKLGLSSRCKSCINIYRQEYVSKNKEKYSKIWADYRIRNLEKVKEKDRKNREKKRKEIPEIIKQQKKKSYKNTKDRVLLRNNRYVSSRIKTDLNFKLSINLRSRLNKAVNKKQKSGSAVSDLGCSVNELRLYIESKFKIGMSWDNYGAGDGKWQIDHITPLCSFNLRDREELLIACHYSNLQPLWYNEHLTKTIQERVCNI